MEGVGGVFALSVYTNISALLLPVIAWRCNMLVYRNGGEGAHYISNLPDAQKLFSENKRSSDQLCWNYNSTL